ncbi:putative Adenylate cyclase [uncultured Spirochaetota bacterium]|jgi:class 3 adenylate cyclase|uniref:Putative Adenylate cyclase n=1 Tax=uncultured Spirochaetota bacterium TaxID=460511 RepID=A0A652ZVD6_9SPIR|nr:putative Adenylate cyclase [uncultured Spirochaetota bacterium]
MYSMKIPLKRFTDEFYFYSSQLVVFFIVIIFLTSGSLAMGITQSLIIMLLMLVQTLLLASQGHVPVLRFLFSFITPVGYSILMAATSGQNFLESTNMLLWGSAVYIGFFQALSITFSRGILKKLAEAALSLGSAVIFFTFYYYLDTRINLSRALNAGQIEREAYLEALKISSFGAGLKDFVASPQHLFALLGIASFDLMLLASRMRALGLKDRLDSYMAKNPVSPGAAEEAARQRESAPVKLLVTAISSDIVGFSAISETLGSLRSTALLNKYYALWTHVASAQGGRILSINGDSVILLFGLANEQNNPERALWAAYSFMDEMESLKEDLAALALPVDLKISIGLHSGMVTSALLGPPGELKRNVYGDTIAVAARLDSLCRELRQTLLVSHSAFRRLSLESQATLDKMGEVLLRQSTRPVPVYSRK